ncbi:hypothetical protein [Kribbella endophytica]
MTVPNETTRRPTAPPYLTRALIAGAVSAVACGIGGASVGEDLVNAIGRSVAHHEHALRLIGWCWSGLPFTLGIAAIAFHARIARRTKPYVATILTVWAGSGALFIPGRNSTAEDRFGTAYPDARFLSYAWAAGFLAFVALVAVAAAAVLIAARFSKAGSKPFSRALGVLAVLLLAAGLVVALVGPLP